MHRQLFEIRVCVCVCVLERGGAPQRRAGQHCYGPDIYHLLRTRMGGSENRHPAVYLSVSLPSSHHCLPPPPLPPLPPPGKEQHSFIDLEMLPPELGITILSYLNATDLCLAGCVWTELGSDEYLWQG